MSAAPVAWMVDDSSGTPINSTRNANVAEALRRGGYIVTPLVPVPQLPAEDVRWLETEAKTAEDLAAQGAGREAAIFAQVAARYRRLIGLVNS